MRIERSNQADIATVNKGMPDETLVVRLQNRGQAPAELEQCIMTPAGPGKLAGIDLEEPVLEPISEWDVDFNPSEQDKQAHAAGNEVLIQVVYEAIGSGGRYSVRTNVKRDLDSGDDERWLILRRENGPYPVGG